MVHPVGCQQAAGVLPQQSDLLVSGDGERIDAVIRHPGRTGVDRLVSQFDALSVERRQGHRDAHRVTGGLSSDIRAQAGMGGEAPGAVDDHPHRQTHFPVQHGRLQLAVAQRNNLGGDGVDPQVGITRTARNCRRQCGIGQSVERQGQEVGVNTPTTTRSVGTHRSTVAGGFN